jgi:hypothetical protein
MHAELIAHMRQRIRKVENVIRLAHDPDMIKMLRSIIQEAEADIEKLEAEDRED